MGDKQLHDDGMHPIYALRRFSGHANYMAGYNPKSGEVAKGKHKGHVNCNGRIIGFATQRAERVINTGPGLLLVVQESTVDTFVCPYLLVMLPGIL